MIATDVVARKFLAFLKVVTPSWADWLSRERQGQKLGQFMLMDALRRSLQNTREIGSIGVVVDAYDDSAERFYLHHEFTLLPGQARKLFLPMATIKKLFPSEKERS